MEVNNGKESDGIEKSEIYYEFITYGIRYKFITSYLLFSIYIYLYV